MSGTIIEIISGPGTPSTEGQGGPAPPPCRNTEHGGQGGKGVKLEDAPQYLFVVFLVLVGASSSSERAASADAWLEAGPTSWLGAGPTSSEGGISPIKVQRPSSSCEPVGNGCRGVETVNPREGTGEIPPDALPRAACLASFLPESMFR